MYIKIWSDAGNIQKVFKFVSISIKKKKCFYLPLFVKGGKKGFSFNSSQIGATRFSEGEKKNGLKSEELNRETVLLVMKRTS